jgi:Fur family peroxide stress response transcriptional regulator
MKTKKTDPQATKIQDFEALCRERGIPLTVQRRAILEALSRHADHPTAEQIYADVQPRLPGVSRTTVYRVLETLVQVGVASKVSHPGAAVRFDAMTDRHHHLLCVRCDRLMDFEDAGLDTVRMPDTRARGFKILDYSIHFRGICSSCRQEAAGGPETRKRASRRSRKGARAR